MDLFEGFMGPDNLDDTHGDIISLWALRLLSRRRVGMILDEHHFYSAVAQLLDSLDFLSEFPHDKPANRTRLREQIAKQRAALERKNPEIADPLKSNLDLLAAALDLSKIEMECLGFCILVKSNDLLGETFGMYSLTDAKRLDEVVGIALGYQAHEVHGLFFPQGNLLSTGMIRLDFETGNTNHVFSLMEGLANALGQPYESVEEILGCFVDLAPGAILTRADYPHLTQDSEILRGYLSGARRSHLTGVNVLLYGPPGTGKTEYVRMLAAEQGLKLFEVRSEQWPQGTLQPDARLSACQFAQKLLAGIPKTLLLFDEIEDVLDPWAQLFSKSQVSKQRVNKILENNTIPTLWVCNNHKVIQPWQLRRFDYVMRMPCPPKSIRHKIADQAFAKLDIQESDIQAIANERSVVPALIGKASRVAMGAKLGGYTDCRSVVLRSLSNRLKAQDRQHQLYAPEQTRIPLSIDYYNTDIDLNPLMDGLARSGRGRVCLYGPPGTGKTSLARLVADAADRTLISRKASDLLGCYVGETEKAIRRMFEEAADEDAVLLIDEIESFISDRHHAQRNWEISQVNEMLVGLESFEGLVIGATNFFERLDRATLRRFDFKIELGYLKSDQVLKMFDSLCQGSEALTGEIAAPLQRQLRKLRCVTPGDFAVIARRMHIMGNAYSQRDLVTTLATECADRDTHQTRIGFMAGL